MPIYRYRCESCGANEEHLQKISDPPIELCATCGGPLAKQMTAAAFHLQGGGWYKDLYASAKTDDSGKSETKTETKTDSAKTSDSGSSKDSSGSSSGSSTTPSSATPSSTPSSSGGSSSSTASSAA